MCYNCCLVEEYMILLHWTYFFLERPVTISLIVIVIVFVEITYSNLCVRQFGQWRHFASCLLSLCVRKKSISISTFFHNIFFILTSPSLCSQRRAKLIKLLNFTFLHGYLEKTSLLNNGLGFYFFRIPSRRESIYYEWPNQYPPPCS